MYLLRSFSTETDERGDDEVQETGVPRVRASLSTKRLVAEEGNDAPRITKCRYVKPLAPLLSTTCDMWHALRDRYGCAYRKFDVDDRSHGTDIQTMYYCRNRDNFTRRCIINKLYRFTEKKELKEKNYCDFNCYNHYLRNLLPFIYIYIYFIILFNIPLVIDLTIIF